MPQNLHLNNFKHELKSLQKDYLHKKFLVAVSGGADSMVLATLMKKAGCHLEAAHVNYHLRGNDSERDQRLVEDFCRKHGIKLHLYSAENSQSGTSIQVWAREIRYRFFYQILEENDLDFIVTAHHLNDQLETFLINLSKSAGLKGLSGIPADSNKILRPLLNFTKDEIYSFAEANCVEFREDESNSKNDYLRNYIRNEISPKLLKTNEHFLENFSGSIKYISEAQEFITEEKNKILKKISTENDHQIVIDKKQFSTLSPLIQFEIMRSFGFESREEIAKIINAEKNKEFYSSGSKLLVDKDVLIIQNLNSEKVFQDIILPLDENNIIRIPKKFSFSENMYEKKEWNIDAEKVFMPLKIRQKKLGDIFYPYGFQGRKLVSKFFKDEKLPILARQKTGILCDAKDQILGIIPLRQDRRFAADEKTEKTINIIFEK